MIWDMKDLLRVVTYKFSPDRPEPADGVRTPEEVAAIERLDQIIEEKWNILEAID